MSSTSTRTRVLSESAHRTLSEFGEDVPLHNGWQRIRCVALSESSSSTDSDASIDIPELLESTQAMEFLGFAPEAALDIYKRFLNGSKLLPNDSILQYAKGHVRSVPDVGLVEDDWNSAILGMGITQSLCSQILDPEFKDLRLTQNAQFWVLDTIEAKYIFLYSLEQNILKPKPSEQGPVSLQSRLEQSKKLSSAKSERPQQETEEQPKPQVAMLAANQVIAATEMLLLKGGDYSRLRNAIRLRTDKTDVNRIQNVLSIPPGDFTGSEPALYFSKQRQTAYQYAEYAKGRLQDQASKQHLIQVGILHVVIPKEILSGAVEISGELWKEFVWNHRLQRPTPEHLQWVDEASVVIGPILSCNQETLNRMVEKGKDYEALEPLKLNGGETASQHFTKEQSVRQHINQRGRFWLETLDHLSQK